MQPTDNLHSPRWQSSPRLLPALIIIAVGVLFLLGNLNVLDARYWMRYWPAILIAVGLVKLVDSTHSGGRVAGAVLMGVGALVLVKTLGLYDLSMHDLWPLFLIGAGLLMLWNRAFTPWHRTPESPGGNATSPDTVNEYAIFGGAERRISSADFRGGTISTIFGGCELDLRRAGMVGDSAVVEIAVIFGGVQIKIPENWIAEVQIVAIFGGVDNKTATPDPQAPGMKRLFIKGAVIFGGVEVKN